MHAIKLNFVRVAMSIGMVAKATNNPALHMGISEVINTRNRKPTNTNQINKKKK